ncbi:hypothetical protein DL95DRAFT_373584 [Leptodontidium sp. 2 PMI_412]|nr:hypothetical protein DL95DRAFT_373584 [Leptodontidium sp. 2 PMI_412]
MAPIFTVMGATGAQGGSVIEAALKSGLYQLRGVTRNIESEKAKALVNRGVEVIAADLDDEGSLVKAFEGSAVIYGVTNFLETFSADGPDAAIVVEGQQGRNLATAASKTKTLQHYIWSTLPDAKKISKGKHVVPHFEAKAVVDEFIKADAELYSKTTFLRVGYYAQNLMYPVLGPNLLNSTGKYIQLGPVPPSLPISSVGDISTNVGVFTSAILAQPSLTKGKYVLASMEETTLGKMLEMWSNATGKPSVYLQVVDAQAYDSLWPTWGREMELMLKYWDDVDSKVAWGGDENLTKFDLGLKDEDFVGVQEAFKKLDWSHL